MDNQAIDDAVTQRFVGAVVKSNTDGIGIVEKIDHIAGEQFQRSDTGEILSDCGLYSFDIRYENAKGTKPGETKNKLVRHYVYPFSEEEFTFQDEKLGTEYGLTAARRL